MVKNSEAASNTTSERERGKKCHSHQMDLEREERITCDLEDAEGQGKLLSFDRISKQYKVSECFLE